LIGRENATYIAASAGLLAKQTSLAA